MNFKLLVAASLAVTVVASASAQLFTDDFNRPDGPLGANWTQRANTINVLNNAAKNPNANGALYTANGFSATYDQTIVSADISMAGTALGFVALCFGHNGLTTTGNGLYIKVQGQANNGLFSHVGFYTGNGISNSTAVTGGATFFALTSQFATARMTIFSSAPGTVNLGIDTDFNGSFEQQYSRTLGTITLGNMVGLGAFGTGVADNYRATVVPEPATLAALGLGAAALLRRRRKA